jgi:hypothetical protein
MHVHRKHRVSDIILVLLVEPFQAKSPSDEGSYRRRGMGKPRTLEVYVSTTSLKGVPSGKVKTARCSNRFAGMGSTAALAPGAFISHPSGNGRHNSFADSARRWK